MFSVFQTNQKKKKKTSKNRVDLFFVFKTNKNTKNHVDLCFSFPNKLKIPNKNLVDLCLLQPCNTLLYSYLSLHFLSSIHICLFIFFIFSHPFSSFLNHFLSSSCHIFFHLLFQPSLFFLLSFSFVFSSSSILFFFFLFHFLIFISPFPFFHLSPIPHSCKNQSH